MRGKFVNKHGTTIGTAFLVQKLSVKLADNQQVKARMEIWDTGGRGIYHVCGVHDGCMTAFSLRTLLCLISHDVQECAWCASVFRIG